MDRIEGDRVLLSRRSARRHRGRDGRGGRGVRHRARGPKPLMRWIVSRSLRFRWLVLFAAAAMMAFGIAQIPSARVDVFPEFAPPRVEIQTIALGNSSTEVEELITVPIEQALNGVARPRRAALQVGLAALLDPAHLRARDRRAESPAAGAGAHRAGHADPADLGQPAVHDAAAVGDEPGHEDRALLRRAEPRRDVVDHVLEDQAAPAAGVRAWRRSTSTASASSSATCRSIRPSWRRTACRSSG